MENLEKQCLEKLNKILSKFDLKIEIVNIQPILEYQDRLVEYRLVDNLLPHMEWICNWFSISNILVYDQSIFDYLKAYYDIINPSFSYIPDSQISKFQRYSKIYQFIQPLKSNCLEEFLIKCDLIGI